MVAELGAQGTREAGQWVQATGESEERGTGGCAGRPSGLCGGNAPPPPPPRACPPHRAALTSEGPLSTLQLQRPLVAPAEQEQGGLGASLGVQGNRGWGQWEDWAALPSAGR